MGLHLHSAACEAYLTEPDDDFYDPLDGVDYPRVRASWKRDRHELGRLARLRSRDRGPWVRDDRGWDRNLDHAVRFYELGMAAHYRYRLRVLGALLSEYERSEEIRYWRCAMAEASMRNRVPLPRGAA